MADAAGRDRPGRDPAQAALRELKEEIGTDKAELLGESRGWLKYDLPANSPVACGVGAIAASGRNGSPCASPATTRISTSPTEHPEFDAWKWIRPGRLPEVIVPFKRQLYIDILAEFRVHCAPSL